MVTVTKNNKDIGTLAAEEGLLSSILYKPDKIIEIIDELNPELFSVKEFGIIYRCIVELWKEDIIPDEVTVINRAVNLGFNITPELIKKLANSNTFVAKRQLKKYCEIIKLHAFKRKTNVQLEEFLENNKNTTQSPEKFVGELLGLAIDLQDKMKAEDRTSIISVDKNKILEDLEFRYNNPNHISGIPFGFESIDRCIDGAERGDIITLGGMNGSCKSYFSNVIMMNMVCWLLKNNDTRKILFISLEMTKEKVNNRLLSIITGIKSNYFKRPRLYFIDNNIADTKENFNKFKEHVAKATEILNKLPIVIDDSSSLSADQVCGIIKKTHLKYGVACSFVDHTGMVRNEGLDDWKSYEYTYSQYMQTAKNTGVPIISLMQYLKSQKENKPDGYRPTLFDIRGGKAAQDASMKILHMWKPDIHMDYIQKHPELKGKIYVLNDKNRDDSLMNDVELQFYGGTLREAKDIMNMNQKVVDGLENFIQ